MKAYLEPEEIERLEQAAEYLRDRLLIRLLFHLGCRVSEALGIKVSDIDFKQGLVTIQHLKQRIKLSCPTVPQDSAGRNASARLVVRKLKRQLPKKKNIVSIGFCRSILSR